MRKTIEKARENGLAFATVRNSNHYGIAAYYAMMALEHDLIGLSMTNSTHLAVPTFGRQKTQGTNPIAVAIPADGHPPFVLDMATTGVTFGRLEVSERKGKPLKPGWAVDADGRETLDPDDRDDEGRAAAAGRLRHGQRRPQRVRPRRAGGDPVRRAVGRDVRDGAAARRARAARRHRRATSSARSASTRCATAARSSATSRASCEAFESSAPVPGAERVVTAGEPERANTERYRREGVPIDPKVWEGIDAMAERLDIEKLERFTVG